MRSLSNLGYSLGHEPKHCDLRRELRDIDSNHHCGDQVSFVELPSDWPRGPMRIPVCLSPVHDAAISPGSVALFGPLGRSHYCSRPRQLLEVTSTLTAGRVHVKGVKDDGGAGLPEDTFY
jgi:hypothetical protein